MRRATQDSWSRRRRAFTLVEVLAAMLFMAIVIPVAMHGVSVASRAGTLGQRKATAMRIAERVLDETIATSQNPATAAVGSVTEGDITYPWTLKVDAWPEDTMTVLTATVSFDVQGNTYDISASTLFDPSAPTIVGTTPSTTTAAATP